MEELTRRTVLIADDDEDIRAIVTSSIAILGHRVIEAADGRAAIDLCAVELPDLAILDLTMPRATGSEVCRTIKGHEGGAFVPVLILTARDGVRDKVEALAEGADDYLTKPFHYQELQARAKALLRVRELTLSLRDRNAELAAMQERIVEQERQLLAAQLGGTAAHRLGQPLSAIMLNTHLIETLPPGDPRHQRALAAIKSDSRRMAEMLEQLRAIDARRTETYFEETDILDLDKEGTRR